ncbi:bile acid:sodium symporter [Streptomyces sp. WAC05858]|uniref:bile acid:sodium symporter n=1 Tax=Streptomyces TaxID=1883 RepID=UPI0021B01C51|nr:bile acid:sodium symporter [Streptomyces sp. WAC05858]WTB04046.1 bile acid:sodium symporter [Streptomyces antimycoticus]
MLAVVLIQRIEDGGIPIGFGQLGDIAVQLLLPFLLGQMLRRWISDWLGRHRAVISVCDRSSILLVVYSAFSQGMTTGIWQRVSPARLALLGALCALLLGLALLLANRCARVLRLPREDRVTAVFCGATKSLASGLPMASVLFPAGRVAVIVLPLMLYHTLQLVLCAWLARRWPTTLHTATTHPTPRYLFRGLQWGTQPYRTRGPGAPLRGHEKGNEGRGENRSAVSGAPSGRWRGDGLAVTGLSHVAPEVRRGRACWSGGGRVCASGR